MTALVCAMKRLAWLVPALLLWVAGPGHAQTLDAEEQPMDAWEALEQIPPRYAYEAGVHMSYGTIGYWRSHTPPWVGFGIRGVWGRVSRDQNRLGAGLGLNVEGPLPLYFSGSVEPQFAWDRVANGLLLGASAGPSFLWHSMLEIQGPKHSFGVAPMGALRVGYSEPWSKVGRRFYAVLEPKFRWIRGGGDYSVAIIVGSGAGR